MHRSLRAGGVVIDSHPMPESSPVESRTSAGATRVGQLEYSQEFTETISKAEESLALLGRQGVFKSQRTIEYRFLIHFESVEEWQEYFDYWSSYYEPLSEDLVRSIHELAGDTGAEIVLDTICQSTAFLKLE